MSPAYYRNVQEAPGGGEFSAGPATAGPWSPGLQHGGPPNALAVAVAERVLADSGRTDLIAVRLSADFLGPVPVGNVLLRAEIARAARSAALIDVVLAAGGRNCLRVRVWFVRDSDTAAIAGPLPAPAAPPAGLPVDLDFPYARSLEWRLVSGGLRRRGPGAAWVRAATPLLDGYAYSGLARAVLIADSASGLSSELDWREWSFVNVDLDVHLARPFEGDWLLMEASTQLGAHGSALARSTLSDARGVVGAGMQTLVLAPGPAIPTR